MDTQGNKIDKKEEEKFRLFQHIKEIISKNPLGLENENESFFCLTSNYYHIKGNEEKKKFSINSKYIIFKNKEKKFIKSFFIHDQKSLENALNESEIKNATLKEEKNIIKNYNSNDSKGSNSSSESAQNLDVYKILNSSINIIEEEKAIKYNKIYSINNFEKRFRIKNVNELDFNFKYYKNIPENNKIIFTKEIQNWSVEISNLYNNNYKSKLLILGPRGVGKTTTILTYLRYEEIPSLYFPIKTMMNFENRKWRKIALNETIYIFNNKEEMENFKNVKDMIPNSQDLFEFIFEYIKFILGFYKNIKLKNKIFIFLDEYDESEN